MKYIFSLGLVVVMTILCGCEEFLDINDDPNNPTEVPLNQLLPTVEIDVSGVVGTSIGGLSAYTSALTHQMFERGNTHQDYNLLGTDFEVITPWNISYYRALTDVREIISIARAEEGNEDWHYIGVAQILQGYLYSVLVDIWGSVPFTEANMGAENRAPRFEDGSQIYPLIHALLDEAIANLDKASNLSPGSDDIIYGGNLNNWKKFARTLKLKMYNQVRLVQDVSSQVNSLLSDPTLLINSELDDFEMPYGTGVSPSTRNPGYAQEYAPGAARFYINPYFFEILSGINTFFPVEGNPYLGIEDPRIPYYFYNQLAPGQPAENATAYKNGEFVSIYMFSFNIDPNEGFDQASSQTVAGLYPIGGRYDDGAGGISDFNGAGDTPQRMLTYFSRLYIQAELALTGVTNQNARDLFEMAMLASFQKLNVVAANAGAPLLSDADRDEYINEILDIYDASDDEGKLQHIITQKWIASYGYGIDSYNDYRRTGYPILHDGNTDALNVTQRTRGYPLSFPWKTDDLEINPNSPSQKTITTYKVFWDN